MRRLSLHICSEPRTCSAVSLFECHICSRDEPHMPKPNERNFTCWMEPLCMRLAPHADSLTAASQLVPFTVRGATWHSACTDLVSRAAEREKKRALLSQQNGVEHMKKKRVYLSQHSLLYDSHWLTVWLTGSNHLQPNKNQSWHSKLNSSSYLLRTRRQLTKEALAVFTQHTQQLQANARWAP